jgi:hypothetical protein
MVLDCGFAVRSNWYFKFENMWLKSEGFVEQVKNWWMSYSFQGSLSFILANKLRGLEKI